MIDFHCFQNIFQRNISFQPLYYPPLKMYALSPSFFKLFAVHMQPLNLSFMASYPTIHLAILQALYCHSSRLHMKNFYLHNIFFMFLYTTFCFITQPFFVINFKHIPTLYIFIFLIMDFFRNILCVFYIVIIYRASIWGISIHLLKLELHFLVSMSLP